MNASPLQAFWWPAANFGDCLTEAICAHYGLAVQHAHPHFAQLIGIGSILERVPANFAGYVLGSGFLHAHSRRDLPQANVLAVRGPLTWERLGRPQGTIFGDPGLLARHLLKKVPSKRFQLGIVAHFADQQCESLRQLAAKLPAEVNWIDVRRPPLEVIAEIAACEGIISSSLHGLIVADALQIPSAWKSADTVLGHGFKFADHAAAVLLERKPCAFQEKISLQSITAQLSDPPRHALAVAAELHDLLQGLPGLLENNPRRPTLPWLHYSVAKVRRLLRLNAA